MSMSDEYGSDAVDRGDLSNAVDGAVKRAKAEVYGELAALLRGTNGSASTEFIVLASKLEAAAKTVRGY